MTRAVTLALLLSACGTPVATSPAPPPTTRTPQATPAPAPAPLTRPTLASMCRDELAHFGATLPGAATIAVVIPRDDPTVSAWAARAMSELDLLREALGDKLHITQRQGGPGSPQALTAAVNHKRCGDAGTEGNTCVELSYRGATGLSLMTPDQPVTDFAQPVASVLHALRQEVEGKGPRFGVVRRPGASFTDLDLTPYSIGAGGHHMRQRLAMIFPALEVVDVRIEDQPIDPTLDGLIVLQSASAWSRSDLERIDELMMRGGKSLLVFSSAANLPPHDATMPLILDTHGIEALLDGYGIELGRGLVLDDPVAFQVQHPGVPRPPPVPMVGPGTSIARVDPSFAPLAPLPRVAVHFASPLTLRPERQPGAMLRPFLFTTPNAVVIEDASSARPVHSWQRPPGDTGERVIGVTVAGELTSAFNPATHARGLVVAVASSALFANPYARAGNPARPEDKGHEDLLLAGWGYATGWPFADYFLALTLQWAAKPLRACEEHWAG